MANGPAPTIGRVAGIAVHQESRGNEPSIFCQSPVLYWRLRCRFRSHGAYRLVRSSRAMRSGETVPDEYALFEAVADCWQCGRPLRNGICGWCVGTASQMPKMRHDQTHNDRVPIVRNIYGERDGKTFNPATDLHRLNAQAHRVYEFMWARDWVTLAEIARVTGDPEASISARLRDLRKPKFGAFIVDRRRRTQGTWEYKLTSGGETE